MPLTLPIKPHSSSVSAFTAASPGKKGALRDTVKRVTRALTTGVTRGSCISRRSRNPTRHLEEFTRGEGKQKGVAGGGGVERRPGMLLMATTGLKAANLEKGQKHTHKNTQRCVHKCV